MSKASDCVVEYRGRYYVAYWNERASQYEGGLRLDIAKATGASGFFCRSEKGLPGAGGYSYKSRTSALRRAREMYGSYDGDDFDFDY